MVLDQNEHYRYSAEIRGDVYRGVVILRGEEGTEVQHLPFPLDDIRASFRRRIEVGQRGVLLTLPTALTLAPLRSKSTTIAECPWLAAWCRGV